MVMGRQKLILGCKIIQAYSANYFKFKMENHQPKTNQDAKIQEDGSQFCIFEFHPEELQCQTIDYLLDGLLKEEIPPFVVTKDYKIRREQHTLQAQSEAECFNIQDKILNYNRKDKSLMQLTRKFIHKFQGAISNVLVLDQVTSEFNVQRRRIYDIINIMESLSVVSKIKKNVYEWKGLKKAVETIQIISSGNLVQQYEKNKKEKSLESLATQFLKLFSISNRPLTLQEAAQIILCEANEQAKKTKIRRLYDIVNVFKCLGLVEKVKNPKNLGGKPIYQWLGQSSLLKIIQEKQSLINNSEQPDDSINSSSDCNQKKQFQQVKNSTAANKLKNSKRHQSLLATITSQIGQFGLKDISNIEDLKKSRRNSQVIEENQKIANLTQIRRQTSFTDARKSQKSRQLSLFSNSLSITQSQEQSGNPPCFNLNLTYLEKQKYYNECPQNRNEINMERWDKLGNQKFCLPESESPSFFYSLVKCLDSTGTSSIQDIHSKLTSYIWPN